tara:strand:+ start:155 stop:1726 length:1572 start_codon:yes stop_codon:yes gene_type:complete
MPEQREIEINVKTDKAVDNVDNLTDAVEDTAKAADEAGGSFDGLASGIDKMTGGLVSGFKSAVTGIKNGVKAMKSLKVAIAATGIGALVLAVGSLVSFFTKTQRGADKINQVFKAVGATIDVLVDRVSSFGEGLFMIISGDFRGGVDLLKSSFKGLGDEIREESAAAVQLEKDFQALQDREIQMIETRAQRRASIEALRLTAADETRDLQARAAALKQAMDLEKQLADEEVAIAAERARILQEQNALGESTREDLQAEAEANARVIELQAQRDTRLKELVATYNSLNKQVTDAAQAIRDEESAILELNTKAVDSKKLAVDNELKLHQMLRNNMAAIDQQYANVREGIEADTAKKTRDQKMAELDIVAGALNGLGQLAGENAVAGKAISAAEAIINTYTGATKALAQGGIFGAVAAAGVVASGIASVRSIFATDVPDTKPSSINVGGKTIGGSGGGRRAAPTTPNIPRPQGLNASIGFDTTGANLGNQIAESLQGAPMRAYVVNQDIQSTEKLDRKIEETATFG